MRGLAWCAAEIRHALDEAEAQIDRYREGGQDLSQLTVARKQVHQTLGVLVMTGHAGPELLCAEVENILDRVLAGELGLDGSVCSALSAAMGAISEYINERLRGMPAQPLHLYPYLRDLLELRKAERIHPADLFAPASGRLGLARESLADLTEEETKRVRQRFELGVLRLLRSPTDRVAAREILAAIDRVARAPVAAEQQTFWALIAVYFRALAEGHGELDVYGKRLLARLNLQLRRTLTDGAPAAEKLQRDVLFSIARMRPASDELRRVFEVFDLHGKVPADIESPRYGQVDRRAQQALAQAVTRMKKSWESMLQNPGGVDANMGEFKQALARYQEATDECDPDGLGRLTGAWISVVKAIGLDAAPVSELLGVEMAISLLFVEQLQEIGLADFPNRQVRCADIARRLDACLHGLGTEESLPSWLTGMTSAVQDRLTMDVFVNEAQTNLREVETGLDAWFRRPEEGVEHLSAAVSRVDALVGVMRLLGHDEAAEGAKAIGQSVRAIIGGSRPDESAASALAETVGNLGFFIDAMGAASEPLDGFVFDTEHRVLRRRDQADTDMLVDVSLPAPAAEPELTLEARLDNKLVALDQALAKTLTGDAHALAESLEILGRVRDTAQLADSADLADAAQVAGLLLEENGVSAMSQVARLLGRDIAGLHEQVETAPADLPEAAAQIDAELLEIFLVEGEEVLSAIGGALERLSRSQADQSALTSARRSFHTLKGSSRMVGLDAFGEAAWALEQLLNHWLAEERAADPALLSLIAESRDAFLHWIQALTEAGGEIVEQDMSGLMARADAMRLGREVGLEIGATAPGAEPLAASAIGSLPMLDAAPQALAPMPAEPQSDHSGVPALAAPGVDVDGSAEHAAPDAVQEDSAQHDSTSLPGPTVADPASDGREIPADAPMSFAAFDLDLIAGDDTPAVSAGASSAPKTEDDAFDLQLGNPIVLGGVAPSARDAQPVVASFETDQPADPADALAEALAAIEPGSTDSLLLPDAADFLAAEPVAAESVADPVAADSVAADPVAELADPEAPAQVSEPEPAPIDLDIGEPIPVAGASAGQIGLQTPAEAPNPPAERTSPAAAAEAEADDDDDDDDDTVDLGGRRINASLFQVFAAEVDELQPKLMQDARDWQQHPARKASEFARRAVHSLKGSAALVGAEAQSRLASTLERALQAQAGSGRAASGDDLANYGMLLQALVGSLRQVARREQTQPIEPVLAAAEALAARWSEQSGDAKDSAGSPSVGPVRPAEDNAPELHDEIDHELLPLFIEEASEYLPQIDGNLRDWLGRPDDKSLQQLVMRQLHTVKGSARMAGVMILGQQVHEMESRVEAAMDQPAVETVMIEELLSELDQVTEQFEALIGIGGGSSTDSEAPAPAVSVAAAVPPAAMTPAASAAAPAGEPDVGALEAEPAMPSPQPQPESTQPALSERREQPRPEPLQFSEVAGASVASAGDVAAGLMRPPASPAAADPMRGAGQAMVRVRSELLDTLVNESGEASIARSRLDSAINGVRTSMSELAENVNRLRQQLREIEMHAETRIQANREPAAANDGPAGFDPLEFDRFTRFQELTRMLAESVNDVAMVQQNAARNLDEAVSDLNRQGLTLRQLQHDLLSVRMVQFGTINDRLYRVVRQSAKQLGKRVSLDVRGANVHTDRGVLERMVAPLEHLLRNAIAHGIEEPARRTAAGKNEAGEIVVHVQQNGNEVVITLSDDGGGLDLPRIRQRGLERGLIREGVPISDEALADLIFRPGFSTAQTVDQISGRGVGMDVVRTEVSSLGGRIEVMSEPGRGSRFELHLPITMALAQVVMVSVGTLRYAVSAASVETLMQLGPTELARAYAERSIEVDGKRVPLYYLATLVDESSLKPSAQHVSPVMLVRTGTGRIAVHADSVSQAHEVVVKTVGPQVARIGGVAGATVLGNGEILLILNLGQLAREVNDSVQDAAMRAGMEARLEDAPATVMVVDDSVTVRKVTQRLLTRLGYDVVLAKDGVDALRQLQERVPDAMLLDIEMPRMDGFDLTRTLRKEERFAGLPIIM
ncbi:MAG: Hpt domain-containing protein, partial [Burkholderiaceae bacterium]